MLQEEWRAISGWPYEVSNLGRVRRSDDSFYIGPNQKPARRGRKGTLLKPGYARGYEMVVLCREGEKWAVTVGRLVCTAFHGPAPSPKHLVAHNDGNYLRNSADNVRWATPQENNDDMIAHGTRCIGVKNRNARLTDEKVREIKIRLAAGEGDNDLARAFGVNSGTINNIKHGRSWRHVH